MSLSYREEFELRVRDELDPWHLCDDSTLLSVVLNAFQSELSLSKHSVMAARKVDLEKEVEPLLGSTGAAATVKYYSKDRRDQVPLLSFLITVKGGIVSVEASASKELELTVGGVVESLIQEKKIQVELAIRDSCSTIYSLFRTFDITSCLRSLDCFIKLIFVSSPLEEKEISSQELLATISSMHKRIILNENSKVISAISDKGDVVRAFVIPRVKYYFYGVLNGKETENIEELSKLNRTFRMKVYVVSKVSEILSKRSGSSANQTM